MKIVFCSGDHPRHAYFARTLENEGLLSGWIRQVRDAFVPDAPSELPAELQTLFKLHFQRRRDAEEQFFGEAAADAIHISPRLDVDPSELNGDKAQEFLRTIQPDVILSFGCGKLSAETLSHAKLCAWNSHGGLSPDYRGSITHFWPSYMLEPQMTGMTLHVTSEAIDGGDILLTTGAELVRGDGLHQLAARTLSNYILQLPPFLRSSLERSELPQAIPQKSAGKFWKKAMWRPDHLRLIYQSFDDKIVDHVLDEKIVGRSPTLINALEPAHRNDAKR